MLDRDLLTNRNSVQQLVKAPLPACQRLPTGQDAAASHAKELAWCAGSTLQRLLGSVLSASHPHPLRARAGNGPGGRCLRQAGRPPTHTVALNFTPRTTGQPAWKLYTSFFLPARGAHGARAIAEHGVNRAADFDFARAAALPSEQAMAAKCPPASATTGRPSQLAHGAHQCSSPPAA